MAVVSQDTPSDFSFSCLDIVLMGRNPHLKRFEMEGKKDYEIAQASMELTSTWDFRDRMLIWLSGGERQRVIIARALTQEPSILLLDEPVSHLDINHQIEILELVDRLKKTRGLLIILVIHDLNLAARYCDRLILLNGKAIQAAGSPAEVLTRENVRKAFRTDVIVRRRPMTGSIYITLMNPVPPEAQQKGGRKIHLVSGAGTGARLMYALASRGYAVTAGVLNVLDSDFETAGELNIKTISERLSFITPEASAQNLEAMKAADFVVVSDVPIGWGNLQNLESVMSIAGISVILVESAKKRDFTGGKATEMFDRLKVQGAIGISSADDVIAKLETLYSSPGLTRASGCQACSRS